MPYVASDIKALAEVSYAIAWKSFTTFVHLSPRGKRSASQKLREYIDVLVTTGERDPEKIGQASLGLLREYEQIIRSQARVTASPSLVP
jgi:hypothetical protein